jgi:uncharacterized protein GlcG (DUF336 family)
VLIVGADGEVAGTVGISGDTGDNDEACVVARSSRLGSERRLYAFRATMRKTG